MHRVAGGLDVYFVSEEKLEEINSSVLDYLIGGGDGGDSGDDGGGGHVNLGLGGSPGGLGGVSVGVGDDRVFGGGVDRGR